MLQLLLVQSPISLCPHFVKVLRSFGDSRNLEEQYGKGRYQERRLFPRPQSRQVKGKVWILTGRSPHLVVPGRYPSTDTLQDTPRLPMEERMRPSTPSPVVCSGCFGCDRGESAPSRSQVRWSRHIRVAQHKLGCLTAFLPAKFT